MLEDDICDIDTGPRAAFNNILSAGNSSGDDMDPRLKANATHPQRFFNAILIIDYIFLRKNMQDFPIHRYRNGFGGINDAADIILSDFAIFDGDNPLRV